MDTPEAREREHARQRCPEDTWNEHGGDTASDARHQEDPPDAGATIILRLDDDGMEHTDNQESADADEQSFKMKSHDVCGGLVLVDGDGHFFLDALLQGDKCLGGIHSCYALYLVVEQVHELLVVLGIELHEHRVRTCGVVAFHNLWNMLELINHLLVERTFLQGDAHVGASGVAQALGIDIVARAYYHVHVDQALDTLMDGGAGNTAGCGYIFKRNTRVIGDDLHNLLVEFVDFFHDFWVS